MSQSNHPPAILIVGSDSLIGATLTGHLRSLGKKVVGTTRRREMLNDSTLYLDLLEDPDKWECPYNISSAVICAGITELSTCKAEPHSTSRTNVQGTVALAKNLLFKGSFVIFLSSNRVFDGTVPGCLPDKPVSPNTEYGRQKAETERQLLGLDGKVSIVRLTKIIENNSSLFMKWIKSLKHNKTIHPFSDMTIAPIPLAFTVDLLCHIAEKELPGIVQLSAKNDVTYEEVARHIARRIGASQELVKPISVRDADIEIENVQAFTSLDTSRITKEFGVEPPDVFTTIDEFSNKTLSFC